MELQAAFETRRSIRHYDSEKKVTKEQVETLIKAASLAPSWKNYTDFQILLCIIRGQDCRIQSKIVCRNSIRKSSAGAGALIVTTFVKGLVGFDNDGNPVN